MVKGKTTLCKMSTNSTCVWGLDLLEELKVAGSMSWDDLGKRWLWHKPLMWLPLFVVRTFLFSHLDICAGRLLLDSGFKCITFCLQYREALCGVWSWMTGDLKLQYNLCTWGSGVWLTSNPTFLNQSSNFLLPHLSCKSNILSVSSVLSFPPFSCWYELLYNYNVELSWCWR